MQCQRLLTGGTTAGRLAFSSVSRQRHQRRSGIVTHAKAAQQQPSDFFSGVARVARKIQAGLPIVGLFSRLTASGGGGDGTDELSYPEYCRALIDAAPPGFDQAVAEFGELYSKEGSRRNVLFSLWTANYAPGIIPARNVIMAARRLRVTFDIEIEMDRFEMTREEAIKNFDLVARPQGTAQEKIELAVDSLCTMGPGLKDGQPLEGTQAAKLVTAIVSGALRDVPDIEELTRQSIANRPARAKLYAV